jgi:hypothetical protein
MRRTPYGHREGMMVNGVLGDLRVIDGHERLNWTPWPIYACGSRYGA